MKTLLKFLPAMLASVMLISCNSDDSSSYPKHIEGSWIYADTQSKYVGMLYIEDVSGGQYAEFAVSDVSEEKSWTQSGEFVYNGDTGSGYINTGMVGGVTVSIQTFKDSDNLKVVMSTVTGSEAFVEEFVFRSVTEENIIPFTTGTWNGSTISGGVTTEETLDVTSLTENFGTFSVTSEGQTTVYNIADLSYFVKIDVNNAIGSMNLTSEGSTKTAVLIYNTVSQDVTVIFNGKSVKLSPVI